MLKCQNGVIPKGGRFTSQRRVRALPRARVSELCEGILPAVPHRDVLAELFKLASSSVRAPHPARGAPFAWRPPPKRRTSELEVSNPAPTHTPSHPALAPPAPCALFKLFGQQCFVPSNTHWCVCMCICMCMCVSVCVHWARHERPVITCFPDF